MDVEMTPCTGTGGFADLRLGHQDMDGIEVVDVAGEIDICTAPRLALLLIGD
jgi:hypothetical protein